MRFLPLFIFFIEHFAKTLSGAFVEFELLTWNFQLHRILVVAVTKNSAGTVLLLHSPKSATNVTAASALVGTVVSDY